MESFLTPCLLVTSTDTWNGSGSVNRGLNVSVSGGTTNYAAIFDGGNVGIGTMTPSFNLHLQDDTPGDGGFDDGGILVENTNATAG